ncbi:hypothetical protein DFQ13_110126 [Actinokineospora spheciospongiae]|nr:hypothetical protein DFQ13_110126 [Actinokineospora spheciospongiae]
MIHPAPGRPSRDPGSFARGRAEAVRAEGVERMRAGRTVASFARDSGDRRDLLSMLDLPDPDAEPDTAPAYDAHALSAALDAYVRAVATTVGVPPEGVTCEVTDTATAYLALSRRVPEHPGRDLMLLWTEGQGWAVSVETRPGEPAIVLARLGGDPVPPPLSVAGLVAHALHPDGPPPAQPVTPLDRSALVERLSRYLR